MGPSTIMKSPPFDPENPENQGKDPPSAPMGLVLTRDEGAGVDRSESTGEQTVLEGGNEAGSENTSEQTV